MISGRSDRASAAVNLTVWQGMLRQIALAQAEQEGSTAAAVERRILRAFERAGAFLPKA